MEDCGDYAEEWKTHALRTKPLFRALPEPDGAKCNVRAYVRRLAVIAAEPGE